MSKLPLYTNTLLNLLNKLEVNSKDDVLKNILTLFNDFLLDLPEFLNSVSKLSVIDNSLPYFPFVKHLENDDLLIKSLCLYNLVVLLSTVKDDDELNYDKEVVIRVFDLLSSDQFIGNHKDSNFQSIGIQLLEALLVIKPFKLIYQDHNLVTNFKSINQLIATLAKLPNGAGLQLTYNALLATWILSFTQKINKILVHNFPELIGNLLIISKDSIKLKIVRISVAILKNFISITSSNVEQFKTIKLLLFHDGLPIINTLKERKFASNGSDEELSNDLAYLADTLSEIVKNKLSSFDEYLTELENPNLINLTSPTHKSEEFWLENSSKFKDSSFKLVKKMFEILSRATDKTIIKITLLNDIQFLIKNLGQDLINFINNEKSGQYKLLILDLLENNNGNNELKYEALKTIQLLVGHSY